MTSGFYQEVSTGSDVGDSYMSDFESQKFGDKKTINGIDLVGNDQFDNVSLIDEEMRVKNDINIYDNPNEFMSESNQLNLKKNEEKEHHRKTVLLAKEILGVLANLPKPEKDETWLVYGRRTS